MGQIKSILITGANAGLGKESARQIALREDAEKIYLACRNEAKALAAKQELEEATGKNIFEIILMDVSNLQSVREAVAALDEPVGGLIMNAGGAGGPNFDEITEDGVMQTVAVNLLGHVVLLEELLKAGKLTGAALYAGSEAVRGVPEMGIKQIPLKESSTAEFASVMDGTFFGENKDPIVPYGPIKYMAALWMSSMARKHAGIRFITMSPGATTGTEALNKVPFLKKVMFSTMFRVMLMLGKVHRLEVGAKRYVDGLYDEAYKSGVFYASKKGVTGPVIDQGELFADLHDERIQDNAHEAIRGFIKAKTVAA